MMQTSAASWRIAEAFRTLIPRLAWAGAGAPRGEDRLNATGHRGELLGAPNWVAVLDGEPEDVEVFYWDQAPILEAHAAMASE